MDTLFDMAETPSPRLLWMAQHGLAVVALDALGEECLEELRDKFFRADLRDGSFVCLPSAGAPRLRRMLGAEPDDMWPNLVKWMAWAEDLERILKCNGHGPTEAEACADYARRHGINHWSL